MNYYYYISSLPDIHLEDTKLPQTFTETREELKEILSDGDAQLADLLFLNYDNANLLALLNPKKKGEVKQPGIFTEEELNEVIQQVKDGEQITDKRVPLYFQEFIQANLDEKPIWEGMLWEDQLAALYYSHAMKSSNKFLSQWFEFNLDLNNVMTAHACRKYGYDVKRAIVGNNEVAKAIRQSNSRDFGLTGIFEQLDEVLRIMEDENLLQREKAVDAIRWKYLDEKIFFHYFSIEKILAYLIKIEIIERWQPLNKDKGTHVFREMIAAMKESVDVK